MESGLAALDPETSRRFETYLSLILRWNTRTNLTSVRDADGILARHFVESISCARALPAGVATLLDLGSGAGFPGLPIALCRPEIAVTLAESQRKKAAFLQEAVRTLGVQITIYPGRAETLRNLFDLVILRAVDKMAEAVSVGTQLVASGGWLGLMATNASLAHLQAAAGQEFTWDQSVPLPGGESRVVSFGRRHPS
jgi:16S rRNA (guanine527-N7)-methyltransferase